MKYMSLGAFFMCYNELNAADVALESFRKWYPSSTVIMVNDGGDPNMKTIANKHNATFKYYDTNIGIGRYQKDPFIAIEWLQRFFDAVNHINEDYFVMQEEDVFHVKPITFSKLKYELNGYNPFALFPEEITQLIKKYNNTIYSKKIHYGGCGGTVFKTDFYKNISKNDDWKDKIIEFANVANNISGPQTWLYADNLVSYITWIYQGVIGPFDEFIELNRAHDLNNAAIIHQYKQHYKLI